MTVISLKEVNFTYENSEESVLNNINLSLKEGEFVSILGHNGSGKSTLAKLLNGLYLPTSGCVMVYGLDTRSQDDLWKIRSRVGMVFQNPDNQLIATIVEDDLAFGPENLGVSPDEIRTRIDDSLDIVEMSSYIKRPPHQLSGGQKQRIAIAGVMAMKPSVVVFDEPTSMLDPVGRREVLHTIKKLRDGGVTVVLITHYMEEALHSDRVIVLSNGSVALDASPTEVFSNEEMLKKLSLKLPDVFKIKSLLEKKGLQFSSSIFDYKDLADYIVKHKDSFNQLVNFHSDTREDYYAKREKVISLDSVNYYYNKNTIYENHVLDDISFSVNKGEFVGVIGSTGSGKSSLLQLLNGLNKINSGELNVLDFSTTDEKASFVNLRKRVGLVFQYPEYQLFEETVYDDVAFGPKNLGISEEKLPSVVNNALLSVSLNPEKYLKSSPFELSGGEKRKVAIAGVLAMEPDILILDEPAAGLDPVSRDEVMGFIKKEHMKEGRTTILVSHDMREISKYCNRVLVLAKGKVLLFDTPQNIYKKSDLLDEVGLDVPVITKLIKRLNSNGFSIDEGIFDLTDFVSLLTDGKNYD